MYSWVTKGMNTGMKVKAFNYKNTITICFNYLCSKFGNVSWWKFSLATAPSLKPTKRYMYRGYSVMIYSVIFGLLKGNKLFTCNSKNNYMYMCRHSFTQNQLKAAICLFEVIFHDVAHCCDCVHLSFFPFSFLAFRPKLTHQGQCLSQASVKWDGEPIVICVWRENFE